jgi:hypothetical protein
MVGFHHIVLGNKNTSIIKQPPAHHLDTLNENMLVFFSCFHYCWAGGTLIIIMARPRHKTTNAGWDIHTYVYIYIYNIPVQWCISHKTITSIYICIYIYVPCIYIYLCVCYHSIVGKIPSFHTVDDQIDPSLDPSVTSPHLLPRQTRSGGFPNDRPSTRPVPRHPCGAWGVDGCLAMPCYAMKQR